jgi:phthiocerol/phenolphthiocerol synthesis type-I polyketide synthase E
VNGDEIAVVGMAGRFPGAADIGAFWDQLLDGVDSATRPTPRVTEFDAEFFGMEPAEARRTDPQHRMFLETCWEAVEDSGHDVTRLSVPVGVFAAASANQYQTLQLLAGTPPVPHQSPDHLATQVAYRLGLTGPAVSVQAACAGALVAVCVAAQNLTDFRCDLAIAGGTNVNLPDYPHPTDGLRSPDGVCRAFDAAGQGSGFASGAGAVVLRRLDDAVADGDHVYAVLRGWAVTNDGANRGGYAVPGVDGQAAAVAEAMAVAELGPDRVGMVEAHGSGTRLGDAIEVAALRRIYRDVPHQVALGSVKTNIGYLDAACGIAGLIKAALAVRHGQIPATLHHRDPNPDIDFGPFCVPSKTLPWEDDRGRTAGVSAFGLGGTNAHVLLSQPPPAPSLSGPPPAAGAGATTYRLPVSAASADALRQLAARLGEHLARSRPALADVAGTLTHGRARLPYGATIACADLDEALAGLQQVAGGNALEPAVAPALEPALEPAVAPEVAGRPDRPASAPAASANWQRVPLPTHPFQAVRHWQDTVRAPA